MDRHMPSHSPLFPILIHGANNSSRVTLVTLTFSTLYRLCVCVSLSLSDPFWVRVQENECPEGKRSTDTVHSVMPIFRPLMITTRTRP
jgi:hypothetical protein